MSLISDPDYLIHALRLTYLRNIEDPYASKLLSFHPRHVENPNVVASGLADVDRWPHLTMPATPKPPPSMLDTPATTTTATRLHQMNRAHSDDSRFAGASSLKYTTTIMGPSRTGLVGMRTTGRRASGPSTPVADSSRRTRANSNDNPPASAASQPPISAVPDSPAIDPGIDMPQKLQQPPPQDPTVKPTDTPSANPVFAPFTRTAEVEARRRARIQARNALAGIRAQQEQERKRQSGATGESSEEDEDDEMGTAQDDEFDPDLTHNSPGSDEGSLLSNISGSQPSAFPIQPRTSTANGNNYSGALSPVAEPASPVDSPTAQDEEEATYAEVTVQKPDPEKSNYTHPRLRADGPPVSNNRQSLRQRPPSLDLGTPRLGQQQAQGTPIDRNSLSFLRMSEPDDMFARKPIPLPPRKPPTSNLSRMLASQSGMTDNPFTELYGAISGRGDSSAIPLDIYFPHANQPSKAVKINARKDATVEEVIGFALWTYWEQKLEPKLDEGLGGDDDPQRSIRLSAIGWSLRIAEDDGEVDEDFPPPDRLRKISGFGFECFAICKATPSQTQQNQAAEAKIARRPSRIMVAKKKPPPPPAEPAKEAQLTLPVPAGGTIVGSSIPLGTLSGTLGAVPSSVGGTAQGPPVYLRICVPEDQDAVLRYTTIHVKSDWYLADVLEHICRRRKIVDWKHYALVSQAEKVIAPLDRTVASLGGATELMLLEVSAIPQGLKPLGRSTDPNALISKRMSEVPSAQGDAMKDFTDAYQSWVVHRKPAVMMSRMEYTLALDGDHIHIMPSTKGYMDNNKTTSYHVNAIQNVRQSKKSRSNFKLDVENKTYDFEAETVEAANSIVARIRDVVKAVNPSRASILRRSRRF